MNETAETPTMYELLANKTREEIIDAWMQDKLHYQGQIRRLQATLHTIYAACRSSADVVFPHV